MLARSRPIRRDYSLGEWCYYWRAAKDSKLVKAHWHGPAMVVCNEVSGTDASRTSTVWVVHGPSLFRCTPEQLRPEFPAEAQRREEKEPTAATAVPTFELHSRRPMRCEPLAEREEPRCQALAISARVAARLETRKIASGQHAPPRGRLPRGTAS